MVRISQSQEVGKACFGGTQQRHGTIIRMIHIYLVWKLELKGIWRDRMQGCLLLLGTLDLVSVGYLWWSLTWLNDMYTLCIEALGPLWGIYFQGYMLENFWLFILVNVKWDQCKDIHFGEIIFWLSIMKEYWLNDSSRKKKAESFSWPSFEGNSMVNVLFYILIGAGLHRCTKFVSKCTRSDK